MDKVLECVITNPQPYFNAEAVQYIMTGIGIPLGFIAILGGIALIVRAFGELQ